MRICDGRRSPISFLQQVNNLSIDLSLDSIASGPSLLNAPSWIRFHVRSDYQKYHNRKLGFSFFQHGVNMPRLRFSQVSYGGKTFSVGSVFKYGEDLDNSEGLDEYFIILRNNYYSEEKGPKTRKEHLKSRTIYPGLSSYDEFDASAIRVVKCAVDDCLAFGPSACLACGRVSRKLSKLTAAELKDATWITAVAEKVAAGLASWRAQAENEGNWMAADFPAGTLHPTGGPCKCGAKPGTMIRAQKPPGEKAMNLALCTVAADATGGLWYVSEMGAKGNKVCKCWKRLPFNEKSRARMSPSDLRRRGGLCGREFSPSFGPWLSHSAHVSPSMSLASFNTSRTTYP